MKQNGQCVLLTFLQSEIRKGFNGENNLESEVKHFCQHTYLSITELLKQNLT